MPSEVPSQDPSDRSAAAAWPHVRVLLATYNGASWLDEQLQSIFGQERVRVSVVASDDSSSDGTRALLEGWARRHGAVSLLPATARFGSAHRNFLRLIRDADPSNADFFALADQDDIWLPHKLERGIACLRTLPADAYSSDVIAFWPDGTRHRISKAQPQRPFDHLFGSPGPGCTFILPRAVFLRLQAWVAERFAQLQGIWVHDWLIYAFVRGHGMRWHIDDQANMLYRQHGRNEIGVNAGWRAAMSRLRHVRSGAYRRDILAIADAAGERAPVVGAVRRLRPDDRLWLVAHVRQFRRRLMDCLILAVFILLMPHDEPA
jgi:rhamnosyltransferase